MRPIAVKHSEGALPNLPNGFAGYRILQLSDIHLGRGCDRTSAILEAVNAHPVDALVLTGDLLHHEQHLEQVPGFLADLGRSARVRDGMFGVYGNHDLPLRKRNYRDQPLRWLDNSAVRISRDGGTLAIIGLNQKWWWRTSYLDALKAVEPGDVKIVLAHYPSTVYLLNGLIDLVISGHTHAGQIRIPGLPYGTNDDIDCRNAWGLSRVGRTCLVGSAGIGYSGPLSVRIFAPPEICVIKLVSA